MTARRCSICHQPGHYAPKCPDGIGEPSDKNAAQRRIRDRAHSEGKCIECMARPHLPDRKKCQPCSDRRSEYRKVSGGHRCSGGCGALMPVDGPRRCPACTRARRGWTPRGAYLPRRSTTKPEDRVFLTAEDFDEVFR